MILANFGITANLAVMQGVDMLLQAQRKTGGTMWKVVKLRHTRMAKTLMPEFSGEERC